MHHRCFLHWARFIPHSESRKWQAMGRKATQIGTLDDILIQKECQTSLKIPEDIKGCPKYGFMKPMMLVLDK